MKNGSLSLILGTVMLATAVTGSSAWAQQATDAAEAKTSVADDMVKRLEGTSAVTLEDMALARDTLARLDLLLEIEKRLADLDKMRRERETASVSTDLANALPPPPSLGGMGSASSSTSESGGMPSGGVGSSTADGYSVTRLYGNNGQYSATLMASSGQSVIVKSGDMLPNGAQIRSISLEGVRVGDSMGEYALPFSGETSGSNNNN